MDINIDAGRAFLVIVLTILGVIFINVAIYVMVKDRGNIHQINLMRKAVSRARNPWEFEDKALEELSELVRDLKPGTSEDSHQSRPTSVNNEGKSDG